VLAADASAPTALLEYHPVPLLSTPFFTFFEKILAGHFCPANIK